MKDLKDELFNLINHFNKRGVGNTYALLNGLNNADKETFFLSHTIEFGKNMVKNENVKPITLNNLHNLLGSNSPLVIDHNVLSNFLSDIYNRIHVLESSLKEKR